MQSTFITGDAVLESFFFKGRGEGAGLGGEGEKGERYIVCDSGGLWGLLVFECWWCLWGPAGVWAGRVSWIRPAGSWWRYIVGRWGIVLEMLMCWRMLPGWSAVLL